MYKLIAVMMLCAQMLFSGLSFAEEAKTMPLPADAPEKTTEIPTTEREFAAAINSFTKEQIIAQLGEPARAEDVKIKGTDKIVASIWYYHNINTADDGTYFPTTELDFIEGKVVQVVYMNNDGSEGPDTGQAYDMPGEKPEM